MSGIQVTDPENPGNNQFSVDKVATDASLYHLLLGRLVMEKIEVSNVMFDQKRAAPGKVNESTTQQEPEVFDPSRKSCKKSESGSQRKTPTKPQLSPSRCHKNTSIISRHMLLCPLRPECWPKK
ncbi:MAG: hypothetical protein ACYSW3_16765 [Planctomycetota bacterium]